MTASCGDFSDAFVVVESVQFSPAPRAMPTPPPTPVFLDTNSCDYGHIRDAQNNCVLLPGFHRDGAGQPVFHGARPAQGSTPELKTKMDLIKQRDDEAVESAAKESNQKTSANDVMAVLTGNVAVELIGEDEGDGVKGSNYVAGGDISKVTISSETCEYGKMKDANGLCVTLPGFTDPDGQGGTAASFEGNTGNPKAPAAPAYSSAAPAYSSAAPAYSSSA
jgi:hypothetical protein